MSLLVTVRAWARSSFLLGFAVSPGSPYPKEANAAPRPPPAIFRKAFENNRPTVVEVSAKGKVRLGVVVGAHGDVLTSWPVQGAPRVRQRPGARWLPARILLADSARHIALLRIVTPDGGALELSTAAVRTEGPLKKGDWLVGVSGKKRALLPTMGRVLRASSQAHPDVETNLYVPVGSPFFDLQGKLAGITVHRNGRGVPIEWVKKALSGMRTEP